MCLESVRLFPRIAKEDIVVYKKLAYCEQAINESTNKVNTDYSIDVKEYRVKIQSLSASFKTWKDVKSQEYSRLKIVVPNSLLEIYNIVNSLGK